MLGARRLLLNAKNTIRLQSSNFNSYRPVGNFNASLPLRNFSSKPNDRKPEDKINNDKKNSEVEKGKDNKEKTIAQNVSATMHFAEQSYEEFEKRLMETVHESNRRRFRLILISTLLILFWIFSVFGERLKRSLSKQTADFAKETLENESLKIQTQELATAVVQTILNDEEISNHAANFLKIASSAPDTQQALLDLTLHILQHQSTLEELQVLAKKLLNDLCNDEEVTEYFIKLLQKVLEDERIRAGLIEVVMQLSKDPEVMNSITRLLIKVFQQKEVGEATTQVLGKSTSELLNDQQVLSESRHFVGEVLGDELLQREGSDALWKTVSHMLQPGVIRITGAALMGFSFVIIKILLSPY